MILTIFAATAAAALRPEPLFPIGPEHRLIEGVATDGQTVWVSSVIDRTILTCRKTCRTFVKLKDSDLHPTGLAWDSSGQRLWVTVDCPEVPAFARCESGALVSFDRKGRERSRLVPAKGFHSSDVSVSGGHVFAGDSNNGAVYWLKPGSSRMATLLAPGIGRSAQGSALDGPGKRLIVADYGHGITAIDLAGGKRTLLLREDGKPLRGIDGMARCGNRFIAVYNGAEPSVLLAFTIAGDRIKVDQLYSGPELPAPTQLSMDYKRILIAGDGNWDKALKPAEVPHGPHPIRAVPLSQICSQ
jgi:hypothetical protein